MLLVIICNPKFVSSVDIEVRNSKAENKTDSDSKSGIQGKNISSAKYGFTPENYFMNVRRSGKMTKCSANYFYHKIVPYSISAISNTNKFLLSCIKHIM